MDDEIKYGLYQHSINIKWILLVAEGMSEAGDREQALIYLTKGGERKNYLAVGGGGNHAQVQRKGNIDIKDYTYIGPSEELFYLVEDALAEAWEKTNGI